MTKDESRAIAFVGVLLLLATAARFMNRPKPITITAGPVDLQALQAAGQALAKPQGRRYTPKKAGATTTSAPIPTAPKPWTEPAWMRSRGPPVFLAEPDRESQPAPGPVNLNRATAAQLDALPGIGPAAANRIIAKRDSLGRFRQLEDLDAIKGIGPALIQKLRPVVVVR